MKQKIFAIGILIFIGLLLAAPLFCQSSKTICEGAAWPSTTVTATGGTAPYEVTWTSPDDVTSTGATKTLNEEGLWTYTILDANLCPSTGGTFNVIVEEEPTFTINAENKCTAIDQLITATGVPAGYTYSWNFGVGASPATSTANSTNVMYSSAGTKTITLNITKAFTGIGTGCNSSCVWTATKTITIGNLTGTITCN